MGEVLYNILLEFGIPKKLVRLIKMSLNETYSKICVGKHLSGTFPIQNDLKQGDALLPVLFNFVFRICHQGSPRKSSLEVNGTHKLLVYAEDVNLLDGNISTMKENTTPPRG
jgi:hypothetical protein